MPETLISPADSQVEEKVDIVYEELFTYDKARIRINDIIDSWSGEIKETEKRRAERYVDMDIESLRQSKDIQEDETFIPNRVIDTNIMRETPEFMAFLKQSNRLAIFRCISRPGTQVDNIETDFTKGLTYQ